MQNQIRPLFLICEYGNRGNFSRFLLIQNKIIAPNINLGVCKRNRRREKKNNTIKSNRQKSILLQFMLDENKHYPSEVINLICLEKVEPVQKFFVYNLFV